MGFDEKFIGEREAIYRQCNYLFNLIDLYDCIFEEDRNKELNYAPAFWSITIDALYHTMILWACKLLDAKEERGIPAFLRMAKDNFGHFSKDKLQKRAERKDISCVLTKKRLEELEGKIKNVDAVFKNLKKQRDKFISHFDKRYFSNPTELRKKHPIKWKDLDSVKKVIDEAFNGVSAGFNGNSYGIASVNNQDVTKIFRVLGRHINAPQNSESGTRHSERSGAE